MLNGYTENLVYLVNDDNKWRLYGEWTRVTKRVYMVSGDKIMHGKRSYSKRFEGLNGFFVPLQLICGYVDTVYRKPRAW